MAASVLAVPPCGLARQPPPSPEAVELDRLVVRTATRSERLLSDVPIRTEVLRGEDIALRAATDFSRVAELVNGLRVESNCQTCNTTEVQLLGLGGAYNQLLFDGVPLMSTLGAVYGLEQIPAAFINRVEVVKGGGSALYGPGAVAGVVNLVPAQPVRSGGFAQWGLESQRGGWTRTLDGRADLVSADGGAGLSVVGQGTRGQPIDFDGDGYTEIVRKDQRVAGIQGWFTPTMEASVRANYLYTREARRGGNRLDQPAWLANTAEALESHYHRGGIQWEQVLGDDAGASVGYSFALIRRKSFYGGLGDVQTDPGAEGFDPAQLDPSVPGSAAHASFRQYGYTENPLHYLDGQFNLVRGAHALAFGVQYRREAVRDDQRDGDGRTTRRGEREAFTNLGVLVQDEWTLANAWTCCSGRGRTGIRRWRAWCCRRGWPWPGRPAVRSRSGPPCPPASARRRCSARTCTWPPWVPRRYASATPPAWTRSGRARRCSGSTGGRVGTGACPGTRPSR